MGEKRSLRGGLALAALAARGLAVLASLAVSEDVFVNSLVSSGSFFVGTSRGRPPPSMVAGRPIFGAQRGA